MSDTDDTDELILIPPDLFITNDLEEPYLSGPYYNVVDSLISQVNNLENRINLIESKSDCSVRSNSLNYPTSTSPKVELMSGIRKYNSSDDINKVTCDGYFESTQSTPQKPQTRFKISSCSSTSTERYSPQQKKNIFSPTRLNRNATAQSNDATKEILQEIDEYICNLQTNSKGNVDKSPKYPAKIDNSSKNSLNLKDLDYMLRKVDLQKREFDKQASNVNKNLPKKDHVTNEQIPSTTDTSTYNESFNEKTDSVSSSSESTQLTALPNLNRLQAGGDYNYGPAVSNVNSLHAQNQNYVNSHGRSPPKRETRTSRRNIFHDAPVQDRIGKNDRRLLSLSHLWSHGDRTEEYMTKEEKILQKLEEEKLRRQHCEQLIHQLQSKTLELQERLAVAVQVDEAKDDAILMFHSSWEHIADRLQTLTKDRNELEGEIAIMQTQNAENMLEATKKITHFENEASKALTLAQSSQEKIRELECHLTQLTAEIEESNGKIEALESDYRREVDRNRELSQQMEQKAFEINEMNDSLMVVRNEISNSRRSVELCQVELTSARTQNSHLESIIAEKDDIIKSMERHNQKLLNEIDTHKKIEKDLQQELNKSKESGERNKLDLRNFYQDQVEIVVRDKLREFQAQLDRAESSMQEELKKRELTIARSAARHIQQIADKHTLEIKLVEEKHGEEARLYQMKLHQAHQHMENLQSRLNLQYQKKTDMAKQLHRVMEAQWLEALKIINNGRSPVIANDPDLTIDQLNVLKSKSHSNLEEVLSMNTTPEEQKENNKSKAEAAAAAAATTIIPPLSLGASTSSVQEDNTENCPYSLNMETPLTSRPKTKQQIEFELQKYIQLLLSKHPGNSGDDGVGKQQQQQQQKENCVHEMPTWQPTNLDERSIPPKMKDKRMKKPWK